MTTIIDADFRLPPFSPVFGIEPSDEDGDGDSTTHAAYVQDGSNPTYTTTVFDDDFNLIQGSTENGTNTDDDYVRLAWGTGGSAWNVHVIADEFDSTQTTQNNTLVAFNDAFVDSLSNQINNAHASGNVFQADNVLLALNLGNATGIVDGFKPDDGTYSTDGAGDVDSFTATDPVNVTSTNSIPAGVTGTLFQSARGNDFINNNINLSIDKFDDGTVSGATLEDGRYVVELFFADVGTRPSSRSRIFDLEIEDELLLNGYSIDADHTRIVTFAGSSYELDSEMTGDDVGLVKRFEINVVGGNGLQIKLTSDRNSSHDPLLNAVRILQPAPRVKDVVLGYSDPMRPARYAFSEVVGLGKQLRPVYHSGIDTIEIHFDSPVNFADGMTPGVPSGNELTLHRSFQASDAQPSPTVNHTSFEYDDVNYVGKWTFAEPLDDDKYAIELSTSLTGVGGQALDGDWTDPHNTTFDDFSDDLVGAFPSGDGVAGSDDGRAETTNDPFRFNFSVLVGDYNQDGITNSTDLNAILDGDGDGTIEDNPGSPPNTPPGDDYLLVGATRHLPFTKRRGDVNDDEISNSTVDGDWPIVRDHYGLVEGDPNWDPQADTDDDGDVDLDDLLNFKEAFLDLNGYPSAWHPDRATNMSPAALSIQDGLIFVSTTIDELDGDLSDGDLSLREAIQQANAASDPTVIILPAGHYTLSRTGTEVGDASYNDLDITGNIRIVGDGAGLSVIDSSALPSGGHARAFELFSATASLDVSHVTLTSGSTYYYTTGIAAKVTSGASLTLTDSAVVNQDAIGAAISVNASDVTIRRSVFTNNTSQYTGGPALRALNSGTVTIGESVFALNFGGYSATPANVEIIGNVTLVNEGNNRYDEPAGGFFDTTPGPGDYQGTPDYVVTSIADTFDHTDDDDALSIREAIDLANQAAGAKEVWLPAWNFVLTRDRGTNVTDIDVSYGGLDIKDSLAVRGVTSATSVAWTPGVVDVVFDLLGDYTGDGINTQDDGDVDGADYLAWLTQNGSTSGTYSADGDDDGDGDDLDIWNDHFGNTLNLIDIIG